MRIVVLNYTHPYLKSIMRYTAEHVRKIQSILPEAQIDIIEPSPEAIDTYVSKADILIMSPLDHSKLVDFSKAPNLKWVHLTAAGASDVAECLKETDILLTNSSGVHPVPIAEHVFMLMLMLARQANVTFRAQIIDKKWEQAGIVDHLSELSDKTIAIVGFGRIGQRIAKIARAFDMQVIALKHSNPSIKNPDVNKFYGQEELPEFLGQADFVVNCLPLTEETTHFFDKSLFKSMKPTTYFINIGRGKTVVENDLILSLKDGTIAGAGLDVYEEEPLPSASQLWELKNAILTPHYAGWTPKYIDRVIDIFSKNLTAYLTDYPMPTLVDKSRKY